MGYFSRPNSLRVCVCYPLLLQACTPDFGLHWLVVSFSPSIKANSQHFAVVLFSTVNLFCLSYPPASVYICSRSIYIWMGS